MNRAINLLFGTVYFILLLIDLFTQHVSVTFYSQAFLIGYCLSAVRDDASSPIPVWTALTINAVAIVYDRTIWLNTVVLLIEWIHFAAALSSFLVRSKKHLLTDVEFEGFCDKWMLFILFLYDIFILSPNVGIVLFIVINTQKAIYGFDQVALLGIIIQTLAVADYYNFSLIVLIAIRNGRYHWLLSTARRPVHNYSAPPQRESHSFRAR